MVYRVFALVGVVSSSLLLIACGESDPIITHALGGTASGVVGAGLTLQNSLGGVISVDPNATTFNFSALPEGTAYQVTVKQQPDAPAQTCTASNGSGSMGTADVTAIAVTCTTPGKCAYATNPGSQSISMS